MSSQVAAADDAIKQKKVERDRLFQANQSLNVQLNAQKPQECTSTTSIPAPGAAPIPSQSCRTNPALKPLNAAIADSKAKLIEAEAAVKEAENLRQNPRYDTRGLDEEIRKAEKENRGSIFQSSLHSYAAMLMQKDPKDVNDADVKILEWYLIVVPSIAAAFSSTLIAMTAVRRLKPKVSEATVSIPDETAAYLFGPLVAAMRQEASKAVAEALNATTKGGQSRSGNSMNLIPSRLNELLAASVLNRVAADMFYVSAKARFFSALGIGLIGLGIGIAVGIGFYGYSFITRNSSNLNALSAAFSQALSEVQLRGTTVGTVQLEPHEIKLAKGQTVSFDPTSRVLLDPSAKVSADGEIKVQTPTISVPQSATPRSKSLTPTITNFTIFKSVPFDKGNVLSGWVFLTSAQSIPSSQYCYYSETSEDSDVGLKIDVGDDEKMLPTKTIPKSFDMASAFTKCVWFRKGNP